MAPEDVVTDRKPRRNGDAEPDVKDATVLEDPALFNEYLSTARPRRY